jgi:hypothetical protein
MQLPRAVMDTNAIYSGLRRTTTCQRTVPVEREHPVSAQTAVQVVEHPAIARCHGEK